MPRTAGYFDGATPPRYVTRAHAYDDTWMGEAACAGHNRPGSPFQHAWTTAPFEKHVIGEGDGAKRVTGDMLIEVALTFCAMCPVQWDCTEWALLVEEPGGTWGISYDDLEWLRRQPKPLAIVEQARVREVAVQVAVHTRRRRVQPVRV